MINITIGRFYRSIQKSMGIGSGGSIASCRITSRQITLTSTFQNAIATLTLGFSPSFGFVLPRSRAPMAGLVQIGTRLGLPTSIGLGLRYVANMRPVVEESEVTVAVSSDAMVACPALRA